MCALVLFWLGSTSSSDTVSGSAKQARRTNMCRNVLTDAALPEGVRAPQISRPAVGHRRRPAAYVPLRRGCAGHHVPAPVTAVVPVKISPLY
jgi:hypothetical protein